MVLSYSGYYTGLSSRISGFDSPQDRQIYGVIGCNGVRFASTLNDHQGFLAWVRIPHDASVLS